MVWFGARKTNDVCACLGKTKMGKMMALQGPNQPAIRGGEGESCNLNLLLDKLTKN